MAQQSLRFLEFRPFYNNFLCKSTISKGGMISEVRDAPSILGFAEHRTNDVFSERLLVQLNCTDNVWAAVLSLQISPHFKRHLQASKTSTWGTCSETCQGYVDNGVGQTIARLVMFALLPSLASAVPFSEVWYSGRMVLCSG